MPRMLILRDPKTSHTLVINSAHLIAVQTDREFVAVTCTGGVVWKMASLGDESNTKILEAATFAIDETQVPENISESTNPGQSSDEVPKSSTGS